MNEENKIIRNLAIDAFNQAWEFLELPARSPEQEARMLESAHASLHLWCLVPDHTATHEAIGLWQLSRVYAVLRDGANALRYAELGVKAAMAEGVDAFYLAYALESRARAWLLMGRSEKLAADLSVARLALARSQESESAQLIADLAELETATKAGDGLFIQLSLHHPKPEHRAKLIDSMHRYGDAARASAGLLGVHTLAAADGETLVGLALWRSQAARMAAAERLAAAVAGDDFDTWEEGGIQGFALREV